MPSATAVAAVGDSGRSGGHDEACSGGDSHAAVATAAAAAAAELASKTCMIEQLMSERAGLRLRLESEITRRRSLEEAVELELELELESEITRRRILEEAVEVRESE